MKLGQNTIKKTKLLFVLDDVLAPGRITNSIDRAGVDETLGLLAGLQEKGWVELFLIAGQQKAKAQAKIDAAGLGKYFSQGNIFFVNDAYLSSKAALDRERHMAQLKKDPGFVDDFFTQHVLTGLIGSGRVKPKECCLVGHDLWTDAFYTARFSKIDFVLVRSALSERAVRVQQEYRWVNIIDLNGADIKKVLLWTLRSTDPKIIESHIFNRLKKEFLQGTDFSGLVKKTLEKRALQDSNPGSVKK